MAALTEADVEEAAFEWLADLGWRTTAAQKRPEERADYGAVVLERRLRDALARIDTELPLPAPGGGWRPHVTPQVTPHVERLVAVLRGEMSRAELMEALGLAERRHVARIYLQPGLDAGLIEMTVPDRPRSSMQKCRLTSLGGQVRGIPAAQDQT